MSAMADFTDDRAAGGGTLRFSGPLTLSCIGDLPQRLADYDGSVSQIDLSGIDRIDTVGAWLVHRFARDKDAAIEGLSGDRAHLFQQVEESDQAVAMRPEHVGAFNRVAGEVGEATGHRVQHIVRPAWFPWRDGDRVRRGDPPSQPLPL